MELAREVCELWRFPSVGRDDHRRGANSCATWLARERAAHAALQQMLDSKFVMHMGDGQPRQPKGVPLILSSLGPPADAPGYMMPLWTTTPC